MKERIGGVVVVLALTAWFVTQQSEEKGEASETVLADALEVVAQVEGYEANAAYIDDVVHRAHETAFNGAYASRRAGRRWRPSEPASFKEDKYLKSLFLFMRQEIRKDIDNTGQVAGIETKRKILKTSRSCARSSASKACPGCSAGVADGPGPL